MFKVLLLRHSITKGNLEKRYVGITDQELCKEGIKLAKMTNLEHQDRFESVEKIFTSPLKRCIQTANILFDSRETVVIEELKEMNFGDFECKNHQELDGDENYQKFIDSRGKIGFPNGENLESFTQRCLNGYFDAINLAMYEKCKDIAIVAHGGVIMAIMNSLTKGEKDFYEWMVDNCEGFELEVDGEGNVVNINKVISGGFKAVVM